jgi:hypothetical protein
MRSALRILHGLQLFHLQALLERANKSDFPVYVNQALPTSARCEQNVPHTAFSINLLNQIFSYAFSSFGDQIYCPSPPLPAHTRFPYNSFSYELCVKSTRGSKCGYHCRLFVLLLASVTLGEEGVSLTFHLSATEYTNMFHSEFCQPSKECDLLKVCYSA